MQEILFQISDYAFGTLGLNRLYMRTLADNQAAIKVLQKSGLMIEGKMRQHFFKNGEFKDVLILGMCASDYAQFKREHAT